MAEQENPSEKTPSLIFHVGPDTDPELNSLGVDQGMDVQMHFHKALTPEELEKGTEELKEFLKDRLIERATEQKQPINLDEYRGQKGAEPPDDTPKS